MADTENKVYILDAAANRYEGMTKEQIITAIMQAVNDGTISNIDAGFITKIQEMNKKGVLKWWVGTQAEFNSLETKDADTLYIFTDDPLYQDINNLVQQVSELTNRVNEIETTIEQGGLNRPAITQVQFVNFDHLETTSSWAYDQTISNTLTTLDIMVGGFGASILCIPSTKSLASVYCEIVSGDTGYLTYDYKGAEDIEDSGYGQVKFEARAIKPCIGINYENPYGGYEDFVIQKSTTFRITITDIYGHQFISDDFTINYKVKS